MVSHLLRKHGLKNLRWLGALGTTGKVLSWWALRLNVA